MNPLYTVYTLSDPEEQQVRYVGVTSQTLTKRLHDMMSACTKPYTPSYTTPVGIWLRSLLEAGQKPAFFVRFEGADKGEANEEFRFAINTNLHTGLLLNSSSGNTHAIRTTPLTDIGQTGPSPNVDSEHAKNSIRRKQRK